MSDQRKVDADHLRLLAVFHFVVAALAAAGIGFLALHYLVLHAIVSNPEMWRNQRGGGLPPREIFAIFRCLYVVFATVLVAGAVGNLLSGLFIDRRKHRTFSLIVAGLNCFQIPFGTVLGVFTLIVLLRPSVREVYDAIQSPDPAPAMPPAGGKSRQARARNRATAGKEA